MIKYGSGVNWRDDYAIHGGDSAVPPSSPFSGIPEYGTDPQPSGQDASASWMWTLADLSILLLTFFVLVFAMTAPDAQAWRSMISGFSLQPALGIPKASVPLAETTAIAERLSRDPGDDLRYVRRLLSAAQAQEPALAAVTLEEQGDHLLLTFPPSFRLAPDGDVAQALVRVLDRLPNQVVVENQIPLALASGPEGQNAWEQALIVSETWAKSLQNAGYDAFISRHVRILYGQDGGSRDTATAPAASRIGLLLLPEAKE